jgi:hypothetical protein
MRAFLKNPLLVFISSFAIIALPLFLFPLNLFEGEIVYEQGISMQKIQAPLSLSYFIGIGYEETEMIGVKTFYLLPRGYILVALFLLGFPSLLAYRSHLNKQRD